MLFDWRSVLASLLCLLPACQLAPPGDTVSGDDAVAIRFEEAVFLDASTILAVAVGFDGTYDPRFVRSENAGRSWQVLGRTALSGPEYDESVHSLTVGAGGSVWAVWSRNDSAPFGRRGLAVTEDRGNTFRVIDLTLRRICPSGLVGRWGSDPLIASECYAQLWDYRRGQGEVADQLVPWGSSVGGTERFGPAMVCDGAVYVATLVPPNYLHVTIWRSTDDGVSWLVDTSTFGNATQLVCGDYRIPWAIVGDLALRRDEAGVWRGVDFLTGVSPTPSFHSSAADAVSLFVSGEDDNGDPIVAMANAEGRGYVPTLPSGLSWALVLAVDPQGHFFAFDNGVFRREEYDWTAVWPEPAPTVPCRNADAARRAYDSAATNR